MGAKEDSASSGATMSSELRNTMNFHVGDFIGVNNQNWDLFGYSHHDKVIVDFAGQRRENVEDHLADMRGLLAQYPDMMVLRHDPNVAQGDWTASVASITGWGPGTVKFVTVAKWLDDKVTEEYLFTRTLSEDEAIRVESSEPTIVITTPDDPTLWLRAGIAPGWTCTVYGSGPGNKTVVFTRREDGNVAERMAFAEV